MTRTVVRGRASEQQRKLWEDGQGWAGRWRLKRIKAGVDGMSIHQAITELFERRGFPTEVRNGAQCRIFPRHRARSWARNSRISPSAKSRVESGTSVSRSSQACIIRESAERGIEDVVIVEKDWLSNTLEVSETVRNLRRIQQS